MTQLRGRDVLYLTYDGLLEPLGASQVLPYLRGLAGRGVRPDVLSFEKPADLGDGDRVRTLGDELAGRGIGWRPLGYHRAPTLPATAWDVLRGRRAVARWSRGRREGAAGPGLVHARGYVPGLIGLAARRHRLLFDMRGFWVDERIEAGYWSPGSVQARVGRWIEGRLLERADRLVLLTRNAADRLPELTPGGEPPPWSVIPTCVDLDRFRPPDDAGARRRELGLGPGPLLVHIGTLVGWYQGRRTMEVGRAWLEATGGSFLVLTRDVEAARALAAEAGAGAEIRSALPDEVPRHLAAADAGLALVAPSPAKDASFPTKIGEYLATGLAVLATPIGDLPELADGGVLRLAGEGEGPGALAEWLAGAASAPDRAERARSLARERLSLASGVEALLDVYRDLGVEAERASPEDRA